MRFFVFLERHNWFFVVFAIFTSFAVPIVIIHNSPARLNFVLTKFGGYFILHNVGSSIVTGGGAVVGVTASAALAGRYSFTDESLSSPGSEIIAMALPVTGGVKVMVKLSGVPEEAALAPVLDVAPG